MPHKDPEKKKEHNRQYYERNKEKRKEYLRQYYLKNKDKLKEHNRQYREKNKDKIKEYNQTPQRKKIVKISDWKSQGIISNDYDVLYERYINTENCENCDCILTVDKKMTKTTRCLDHDHSITDSENVRNILCNSCNIKRK